MRVQARRVVISFDLNSVADDCTIGGFAVVVIGGLAYWFGVIRPMKADAEWWATNHKPLGPVVVVVAILTSRTRNDKKVLNAALVKDPGWPRRLRAHFHAPAATRFYVPEPVPDDYCPSVPVGGLAVPGKQAVEFKDVLLGETLPYGKKTRLRIQVGKRKFSSSSRKERGEDGRIICAQRCVISDPLPWARDPRQTLSLVIVDFLELFLAYQPAVRDPGSFRGTPTGNTWHKLTP